MYGQVINVPAHPNLKLPAIGGHLPNADATVIYWLSVPVITDSSNKCRVFGGRFNPKSLAARTLSCDRHFAQIPMLPSGDHTQCFISQTLWLHSFYDITSSALNPRGRRRERFLVLTSAHRVEHVLSRWCGKTQRARIERVAVVVPVLVSYLSNPHVRLAQKTSLSGRKHVVSSAV